MFLKCLNIKRRIERENDTQSNGTLTKNPKEETGKREKNIKITLK